jgi:hypothetical protein
MEECDGRLGYVQLAERLGQEREGFVKKRRTRSQIGRGSREKGHRGEREFAIECGWLLDDPSMRRGQQFQGTPESPDVVGNSLPGVHFEVKRCESLSIYKAMEQAVEDAGPDKVPVVAHRRNNRKWLVVMRMEDVLAFTNAIMGWVRRVEDAERVDSECGVDGQAGGVVPGDS